MKNIDQIFDETNDAIERFDRIGFRENLHVTLLCLQGCIGICTIIFL